MRPTFCRASHLVALRIQPCKGIEADRANPGLLVLDQRADHGRSCPDPGSEERRGIRLGRPRFESLRRAGGRQHLRTCELVAAKYAAHGRDDTRHQDDGVLLPQAALSRISANLKVGCPTVEPFSAGCDEVGEIEVAERGHVREQGLEIPRRERVEVEILQRRERVSRRGKVPTVRAGSREVSILGSVAWKKRRLRRGLPGEQAEEASEDEVRSPLFAPALFGFKGSVVQSREEALAQVELVEGSLRSIERDAACLLVEGDSAT